MFLCRYCRTEQEITDIEYERLKVCLCPNCKMICCLDYCVVMKNGRWNGPAPYFPTEGFDYKQPTFRSLRRQKIDLTKGRTKEPKNPFMKGLES